MLSRRCAANSSSLRENLYNTTRKKERFGRCSMQWKAFRETPVQPRKDEDRTRGGFFMAAAIRSVKLRRHLPVFFSPSDFTLISYGRYQNFLVSYNHETERGERQLLLLLRYLHVRRNLLKSLNRACKNTCGEKKRRLRFLAQARRSLSKRRARVCHSIPFATPNMARIL